MSTILSALRSRRDARLRGDETGFSLIELMIVLLIIAILLAVAIPTYLSARARAENRAAQETLAHALVSAQTAYASQGNYTTYPGGATSLSKYLDAQNPGVTFNGGNATPAANTSAPAVNSVGDANGGQWVALADWEPDGKCFYMLNIESTTSSALTPAAVSGPGTYYAEGSAGSTSGCTATDSAPSTGWQTSWASASTAGPTTTTT